MGQAYDDYMAKMAALDTARGEVVHLINRLRSVFGPLFDDWRKHYLLISGHAMPMGMANTRGAIDATNGVPTVQEVQNALIAHFNAREAAMAAYKALPEIERRNLIVPKWGEM